MKINFKTINHIQLCIPKGEEDKARKFYCDILGLKEIKQPDSLKNDGGFWLEMGNIELHIGIENFDKKSKQHPAFEIDDLVNVKRYLIQNGVKTKDHAKIPGVNRFSIYDFWDNRIELIQKE